MSLEKYRADSGRWLAQARADLDAAQGSIDQKHFEWAAFQSQQSGEKALKALWLFHARDPWGHSLVILVQEFPIHEVQGRLADILDLAKKLDKLYIPTRYPNGLPDLIPAEVYTEEEANEAVKSADTIVRLVSSLTG